jgi:hypothetical protein
LAGCSVPVVLHSKLWWQDGPVVWAHFWWDRLVVAIWNVLDFHEGKSTETKCKMTKHFVNLPKSQWYIKSCMNIRVQ